MSFCGLSSRESSALLTLFDHYIGGNLCIPLEDDSTVSKFYMYSKKRLSEGLKKLGWKLEESGRNLSILEIESNKAVEKERMMEITKSIESSLNKIGIFPYSNLILEYFKKSQDLLMDFQKENDELLDQKKLLDLECQEIFIDEAEETTWNEENEWNFSSTSAGIIYFPNANKFNQKHKDFWLAVSDQPHRFYRDYFFRSVFVPFHEIIHCFQGHKWKMGLNLWKAEFEASYAHLEFFFLSCRKNDELDLFYETKLWLEDLVRRIHQRIVKDTEKKIDVIKIYECWRDEYGVKDPFDVNSLDIPPHMNSYFKLRLPIETFRMDWVEKENKMMKFLKYHWKKDLEEVTDWILNKPVPNILKTYNVMFV